MTKARESGSGYRNIKEAAARGEYSLIDPLDYLILGAMNDEGTMFGGLYPEGHSATQLSKTTFEGKIEGQLVGHRIGVLRAQGLIVRIYGLGAGSRNSYQRTAAGKAVYEKWSANHGSGS